ncbi:MAG: peptidoglycan-binding protein [Coriobacteriales bacterium]|jgi:peptidoglycan hydrolase-like protein with peptidoglycan-binding domain|nr:peptidoglycan-binding protein [Coriobacteriales bacterium]
MMTLSDIPPIASGQGGPAVRDVQTRLLSIGYDLGGEADENVFGPKTAHAVSAFRERVGLAAGESVDAETWAALVDASFTFGDRVLYLRMPYFHGRDVRILQTALISLGFSCAPDGIFGAHTERAVREFQMNAGFKDDGIVGDATWAALNRLRHAWEGRDLIALGDRPLGFARAAAVLETTPICVFGTDATSRAVAERISNLAAATTCASLVVSAPSLDQVPGATTLMVQLAAPSQHAAEAAARGGGGGGAVEGGGRGEGAKGGGRGVEGVVPVGGSVKVSGGVSGIESVVPSVLYDSDVTVGARLRTAVELTSPGQPRIAVQLLCPPDDGLAFSPREEQHAAIILLDALCQAFD